MCASSWENFKGHAPAKLDEPVQVFQRCGTGEIKDFVVVDSEIHSEIH